MKALIISDTHIGVRQDNISFLNFFEEYMKNFVFKIMEEKNIDTIIHLGDWFDRRKYININSLKMFNKVFVDEVLKRNIKVYGILGNHDIYYNNTSTPNILDEIGLTKNPNFFIYLRPDFIYFSGKSALMLPWINKENESESLDKLKNWSADYCFCHSNINGFKIHSSSEIDYGFDKSIFNNYNYVLSGHIHTRQKDKNIFYVGSPYVTNWGEYGDTKGIHIIDFDDDKIEFIPNPKDMFIKIYYNNGIGIDLKELKKMKGAYIKVIVQNKIDYLKFDSFIDELENSNPANIQVVEDHYNLDEVTDDEIANETEDTLTIIDSYVDELDLSSHGNDIKLLLKSLYTESVNMDVDI